MSISSQHHSFDIMLAAKYGIEEAILIHHFQHWIRINRRLGRNIKDGKVWTYQAKKEIQAHFPYMNYQAIRYTIDRLVEIGILIRKSLNKNPIDKTCWYAFADEAAFGIDEINSNNFYDSGKPPSIAENRQPIPDTINSDTSLSVFPSVSKDTFGKTCPPQREDVKIQPPSKESQEIVDLLWSKILARHPKAKPPNLIKWAEEIDRMVSIDRRSWDEIRRVIEWAFERDTFWPTVLQSAAKLRKHYDSMVLKMKPIENRGARYEKNRAIAFEMKSAIKANQTKWKNFYISNSHVIKVDTNETIPLDSDSKFFEAELLKTFGIRKE